MTWLVATASLPASIIRIRRRRITPVRRRPLCGARTPWGRPCRERALWDDEADRPRNGRCRAHGGLSTGPKTSVGRQRALRNLRHYREGW